MLTYQTMHLIYFYHPDIPLKRNTMEFREVNHNGKLLLEMCKNVDVTDKLPSDYAVSNVNLLSKVKYFSISDLTRFSDHCIIKVSLRTNFSANGVNDVYFHLPLARAKVISKNQYKNRLENTLSSAQCQFDIAQFCSTTSGHDQLGVNVATTQLSNIITTATRLVIPPKFSGRRKKKYRKKWYDRNCLQLRNELNRLSRRLSEEPFNSCLRKAFIQCRRT